MVATSLAMAIFKLGRLSVRYAMFDLGSDVFFMVMAALYAAMHATQLRIAREIKQLNDERDRAYRELMGRKPTCTGRVLVVGSTRALRKPK